MESTCQQTPEKVSVTISKRRDQNYVLPSGVMYCEDGTLTRVSNEERQDFCVFYHEHKRGQEEWFKSMCLAFSMNGKIQ